MSVRSIPTRLKNEPLCEVVWEIRFDTSQATLELLAGQLHVELQKRGWTLTGLSHLPASNIPPPVRLTDANFRYMPVVRLDGVPLSVVIGDRVVALSCCRPYVGWSLFGKCIRELVDVLKQSGLLERPERFSLKYVDVIQGKPDLHALALSIRIGDHAISNEPLQLRAELKSNDVVHIVEVVLPATIRLHTDEELQGTMIAVDTLYVSPEDSPGFWKKFDDRLEHVHISSKEIFFSLLTEETIESLGPEYK